MPSIRSLFLPEGAEDPDFNLDDFLREADNAAAASPTHQYALGGLPEEPEATPPAEPSPPAATPSSEAGGEDGGLGTGEPVVPPVAEPPVVAPPADPLLNLPPERRQALLSLDQIMASTPGAVDKVFEALKPEPPRPVPTLPEHVDPDSFEATLWRQNQEILTRFDRQEAAAREAEARQSEQQRLTAAAGRAGVNFQARYPQLSEAELTGLGQRAYQSGLAPALAARPGIDPTVSYEEALEATLWTDPTLRAKVGSAPAVPVAPVTGPTPEREAAKRTLHALSSGAVPVAGPPPAKVELETRADGRFTPDSRGRLVDQLAGQLRASGYK
jgi:hypothetical protein